MKQACKLTLSMPCYGRPMRTKRAIECILRQQTTFNWEAFISGDGCPVINEMADSGYIKEVAAKAERNGNRMYFTNTPINFGGCGYVQTNANINKAHGEYLIF